MLGKARQTDNVVHQMRTLQAKTAQAEANFITTLRRAKFGAAPQTACLPEWVEETEQANQQVIADLYHELTAAQDAVQALKKCRWMQHRGNDNTEEGWSSVWDSKVQQQSASLEHYLLTLHTRYTDRLDALTEMEEAYHADLDLFQMQMRQWEMPTSTSLGASQLLSTTAKVPPKEGEQMPAVVEYDAYLAQHGRLEGWLQEDHDTFVRILTRTKSDKVMSMLQRHLPHLSNATLTSHLAWFNTMQALTANKREALKAWRLEKQKEKEAAAKEMEEEGQVFESTVLQSSQHLEEEEVERRALIKEKIEAWKREQAKQKEALPIVQAPTVDEEELERRAIEKAALLQHQREQREREEKRQEQLRLQEEQEKAEQRARWQALKSSGQLQERLQKGFALRKSHSKLAVQEQQEAAQREKESRLQHLAAKVTPQVERDPQRARSAFKRHGQTDQTQIKGEKERNWWQAPNIALHQVGGRVNASWRAQ